MKFKIVAGFIGLLLFFAIPSFAQDTIHYYNADQSIQIGDKVQLLEDTKDAFSIEQVLQSKDFYKSTQKVPNLQITKSAFWVKMIIANNSNVNTLAFELEYPTIDSVIFVKVDTSGNYTKTVTGEFVAYTDREFKHQNYIFLLDIPHGQTREYLMKVVASEQMQLPLVLGTSKNISETIFSRDLIFGLYAGVILVMVLYNLFVFFTVKDETYLYYVFYILFVGLAQACLQGYAPRFFYPHSAFLANAMMVWVPALSGIFGILFLYSFVRVKEFAPVIYRLLFIIIAVYAATIVMSFFGEYRLSANMMLIAVMLLVLMGLLTGIIISIKGYRPAKFFLIAFSIFIASVVVFVLRNFNILPYNNFSFYALQIGSACEVVLLSIALADKINIFRREKEESQMEAMQVLQENERIVREQNVMLEAKVNERTLELRSTNEDLNKTMTELKEAESQLVESEKMASLGQLTAGIAHEINNPINFVTSNVGPLKRDVDALLDAILHIEEIGLANISDDDKKEKIEEYKEEIDFDYLKIEISHLLKGINEGASRTAEIVKGLRVFSRLDEDDLKKADLNEGLDSTLIISNNLIGNNIQVVKEFGNLPLVECYPGKLNQVFMNMISNAVHAINKQHPNGGGILKISTSHNDKSVFVKIEDNGTGMDENTKKKIYEPFFTTKDVGEGTGLGMSISYNTIKKHNGQIYINSTLGVGTEFILDIPIVHEIL